MNLKANDGLIDEMQLIEDIIKENIGEHEMGLKGWEDFKHGQGNPIPSPTMKGRKTKSKARSNKLR